MGTLATVKRAPSLASKIRRLLKLQTHVKACYKAIDELEAEVISGMRARAKPVKMNKSGTKFAELVDNYAEKNKVFRAHGISRFEINVHDASPL